MIKKCRKCGCELNDSNWLPSGQRRQNYLCRKCHNEYARNYYRRPGVKEKVAKRGRRFHQLETKEHRQERHLIENYDFGLSVYNEWLNEQGRVCWICGGVNSDGKALHVDHNHRTGKIRRLLCNNCNNALGKFKVDGQGIKNLLRAIEHMNKFDPDGEV